jgi:hypothetical protein
MRALWAAWHRYWFSKAPFFNLAVVRVLAVGLQMYIMFGGSKLTKIREYAALPDEIYNPLPVLNALNLPFGWGFQPPLEALHVIYYVTAVAGVMAFVGLLTNVSLFVFAVACVYLHAFFYSFGDFHHPEAVMMVALTALALSPAGNVLSLDWVMRRRMAPGSRTEERSILDQEGIFAGWAIKMMQWFFVLMYLSAVWNKLSESGLDWANGYTLQFVLLRDGLRWDEPLGMWLGNQHGIVTLLQTGVILFQSTFVLAVLFPKLRWIYVPAGICMHTSIAILMDAVFLQWIVLYAVFIPWAHAFRLGSAWLGLQEPERVAS